MPSPTSDGRASWELLVTAPVSPVAVVLGKFVALWCLFMACLLPWAYFLVVLRGWNGKIKFLGSLVPWFDGPGLAFDPGPIVGGSIALAVVGGTFVAVGLFCSGLCRGPAFSRSLGADRHGDHPFRRTAPAPSSHTGATQWNRPGSSKWFHAGDTLIDSAAG